MPSREYFLHLEFHERSLEYGGWVEYSDERLPSELALDAVELDISAVAVDGRPHPFAHPAGAAHVEIRSIPPGARTVRLQFRGKAEAQRVRGLYRSPLGEGEMLTTQLEPCEARRVFPCLDRPDAKAVFRVEVVVPEGFGAIGNTEAELHETAGEGRTLIRFAPTPPMSTYLLYLGIGRFEELRADCPAPRMVIAAAPGRAARGRTLLNEGGRALAYFGEYYGIPYPLSKLHVVAVPNFFGGAMENWGAIAYAETIALIDESTPAATRFGSFTVLLHEIAHQWFGNLVTMKGWEDLWLNESFASFVSYRARETLYPGSGAWEEFALQFGGDSMWLDALPHTHPIRVKIADPDAIVESFDEISYGKGGLVLRMTEAYLGEPAFRAGVSEYLRKHSYGNAEAADLWKALGRASELPVERVLPAWIERPGYPIVEVRREGERLHFEQRRFSFLGADPAEPWPIPLTYRVDGRNGRLLFDTRQTQVEIGAGRRVVVGPGKTGFYRVRYAPELREELLAHFSELDPFDRWGLLDDARALFFAGLDPIEEYLRLLRLAETDTSSAVVGDAYLAFEYMFALARRVPRLEQAFHRYFSAQVERLGLARREGEPDSDRTLRERVLRAYALLDRAFARRLAAGFGRLGELEPELRAATWVGYGVTAGPQELAELRRRLTSSPPGPESRDNATALAVVPRPEWLRENLRLLGEPVLPLGNWHRMAHLAFLLNPDASEGAWRFLTEDFPAKADLLHTAGVLGLVLPFAIPLSGLDRVEATRAWLARQPFPQAPEAATKGAELLTVYDSALRRLRTG